MTGVKHEAVNKVYLENMTSTDGRVSEAWLHLIIVHTRHVSGNKFV